VESARHEPYRRWWGTRRVLWWGRPAGVKVGQARNPIAMVGTCGVVPRTQPPESRYCRSTKSRSRACERRPTGPKMTYTRYFPESWDTNSLVVYVVGVTSLLFVLVKFLPRLRDPRLASLPPHAPGWPIINQTFVHQQDDPTKILIKWAQKYGELFLTTSGTTTFVWINSRNAFKELIDRKSSIYSSRHPMPMTQDVVSAGKRILFMPYGKEWRTIRQTIHKVGILI
jgi:Cytochrome P450